MYAYDEELDEEYYDDEPSYGMEDEYLADENDDSIQSLDDEVRAFLLSLKSNRFIDRLSSNNDLLTLALESKNDKRKYNRISYALAQGVEVNETHLLLSLLYSNIWDDYFCNSWRMLRDRFPNIKIHILDVWNILFYASYDQMSRYSIIADLPESIIVWPDNEHDRKLLEDTYHSIKNA